MQKLTAWFTTGSGLSLVVMFVLAGLRAIQTHFTGSANADIGLVISVLGLIFHPTDMVGGSRVPKM
jgi:hypothetical protein